MRHKPASALIFICIAHHSRTLSLSDLTGNPQNNLVYESQVSKIFTTEDGEALGWECTQKYLTEATIKTASMMQQISDALSDLGCIEIASSITQTQSFVSAGDKVRNGSSFEYILASLLFS